eukprot:scpid25764/ scgid10212/ Hemicentin-1; Fibulin-6
MAGGVLEVVALLALCLLWAAQGGHCTQFLKKPESMVVSSQAGSMLHCQTDSKRVTTYAWTFNGQDLPPKVKQFKYRNHTNGSLSLFSIQRYPNYRTESLRFQCRATDALGTVISSTASVSLAYLDPYPSSARARRAHGIPGNTAVLSCPGLDTVQSRPKAEIVWYKDGKKLTVDRALVLPSGDLQLANYSPKDNGRYQCFLLNKLAQASPATATTPRIPGFASPPGGVGNPGPAAGASPGASGPPVSPGPGGRAPASPAGRPGGPAGFTRPAGLGPGGPGSPGSPAGPGSFTRPGGIPGPGPAGFTRPGGFPGPGGPAGLTRPAGLAGFKLPASLTGPGGFTLPAGLRTLSVGGGGGPGGVASLTGGASMPHTQQYMSPGIILTTETLNPVLTFQKLPPSRSTRPILATVGDNLIIETVATARINPTISWSKLKSGQLPADRFLRLGQGNLQIKSVRVTDSGYYRITARSESEVSNHFIHLLVQEKPAPSLKPAMQTVKPGALVTLACTVTNTPYSALSWYHNGKRMVETTATITLESVDVQHDGYYQCFVGNNAGIDMATARIKVEATPSFAVEPLIRVAINVSQTLRLSCAVTGKPLPKVSWRRNGVAMDMNAQLLGTSRLQFLEEEVKLKSGAIAVQSDLIVNNSASDVMGSYSCYAKNSLGETRSQATRVEVQGPPELNNLQVSQFAVLGKQALLRLNVSGLPAPTVEWTVPKGNRPAGKPGRIGKTADNNLRIDNARLHDSGNYHVVLRNMFGMISADITLDVYSTPSVLGVRSQARTVKLGESFWLSCNVTGVPQPNITWYREQDAITDTCCEKSKYSVESEEVAEIPGEDNVQYTVVTTTLTIRNVEFRDLTKYSCRAHSHGGLAMEPMTLRFGGGLPGEEVNRVKGPLEMLPLWSIALIIATAVLLILAAFSLYCLFKHKKRDRRLIRKLSQPHANGSMAGMTITSNERVVGDGEDSSPRSSSKRQATESTQYPLAMKKLSQPIEPGRTRSGKSEQLSAQDSAAESDQVPGGNPYERTPGPGYNTPAVEGAQTTDLKRHTSRTPVPAARSRRGRSPSAGPSETTTYTGSSTFAPVDTPTTDGLTRPVPMQRKDSTEGPKSHRRTHSDSKGGRQAQQGRTFVSRNASAMTSRELPLPEPTAWTPPVVPKSRPLEEPDQDTVTHFGTSSPAPQVKPNWAESTNYSHV